METEVIDEWNLSYRFVSVWNHEIADGDGVLRGSFISSTGQVRFSEESEFLLLEA